MMKLGLHALNRRLSALCVLATISFGGMCSPNAQVNVTGTLKLIGTTNVLGQSGVHQYTHIWAFSPPNGTGGAGFNDNLNFKADVMSSNSIDGVSLIEGWSQIETSQPTTVPCAPSDLCQPDPLAPGMYHYYSWNTFDSTSGTSTPVYQWLNLAGNKKVNLLITGAGAADANSVTPHYVTSSWWYSQFSPQRQDVINGLKDCTGQWDGTAPSGGASALGGTVTVNNNNCCVFPVGTVSESSQIHDQDLVWVNTTSSSCGSGSTGVQVNVTGASTFTYTASSCADGPVNSVKYASAAQSWAVPYELPYKSALKAYWAAVVAHYGPGFTLGATNYYPKLNYFRFGGSVGSEWFPYCTSGSPSGGLKSLAAPYKYWKQLDATHQAGTYTGWLDYYKEMGDYLQSLAPPFQIVHSINAAETSPTDFTYGNAEAQYAVGWSNRFGVRDGFGNQGLSVQDVINCTPASNCNPGPPNSASNWYILFPLYSRYGAPLELQPIALSYPGDKTCTNGCNPNTYAGDLPAFLLPFSTSVGGTDYEIYWRDLSLAYDVTHYCTLDALGGNCITGSASLGGQIPDVGHQNSWFQSVGQGNDPPDCGSNSPQSGATGKCTYAINIDKAHGSH